MALLNDEIAVERECDFLGATMQLAARLCSHAQPEQVLLSNVVAELCLGKALLFKDLGDVFPKRFQSNPSSHCRMVRCNVTLPVI
jgi:class 3 adenylate cyclase